MTNSSDILDLIRKRSRTSRKMSAKPNPTLRDIVRNIKSSQDSKDERDFNYDNFDRAMDIIS